MNRQISFTILLLASLIINISASAQSGKVPPFQMMQPNGKIFRAQNLPIGKPIVIIYFSPDCEECQKLTKELLERINDFKNVSFAMITYQPIEMVSQYMQKNRLGTYPNIYVGTEGSSLFVRNYYNILKFPFMTLYNKNGDLIVKYTSTQVNVEDLHQRVKSLGN